MKAIVTKYIPATNTKPSRVKAKAEGVPAIVISYGSHDNPHREAALTLCRKYGWGEDIIGGGMPDQTGECFVFAGHIMEPLRLLLSVEGNVTVQGGIATLESGRQIFSKEQL